MKGFIPESLTVGVLAGGDSSERKISLRSGRAVTQGLARSGFDVLAIDPKDRQGTKNQLSQIDVAFIALHGHGGEDGKIQKLLERAGVPYIGSGPRESLLAFDKVKAKRIFERSGIPTPPWRVFRRQEWRAMRKFPAPFFVKPVANGSSIGVFLVEDFDVSAEKIMRAFRQYPVLLAEKQIVGREFTVGILADRALPVIELRPKRQFYDYTAKYTRGMTEYRVPAPIPDAWRRRFQQVALEVNRILGLRDLCRVDLMTDASGNPFVLEANTIPGFTELSLLPKAARKAGISFDELCQRLVRLAWKRRNGKA